MIRKLPGVSNPLPVQVVPQIKIPVIPSGVRPGFKMKQVAKKIAFL